MKRIALSLLLVLLLAGTTFAAGNNIAIFKVFTAKSVVASATVKSKAIPLSDAFKPNGYFSLQVTATGTGTGKITYELSNDGVTFVTPDSATDIVTAQTAASDFYSFAPELAKWMKIVVEETVGANTIVITATLAVQ
jgi:hypothetical protein